MFLSLFALLFLIRSFFDPFASRYSNCVAEKSRRSSIRNKLIVVSIFLFLK